MSRELPQSFFKSLFVKSLSRISSSKKFAKSVRTLPITSVSLLSLFYPGLFREPILIDQALVYSAGSELEWHAANVCADERCAVHAKS